MRLGIDIGGTKIEGIALDDRGRERARIRVPTPARDYSAILTTVCHIVSELERGSASRGTLGIGIPGAISPATGLVKNASTTCLIGKAFDKDLEARLGRPVRLANDANCFAMSESVDGAGADARVVFGVILGTGAGGGIVVEKRVLTGANAIAGEWGHNPLPWPADSERPGPRCYCGKFGCIETFVSGPAFARDFHQATGRTEKAEEIAAAADAGDREALATVERYEERLARALATVINILDPDVIVLGGGMSNMRRLYETVPRLWQRWVFSDQADTPLRQNAHGDSSGVRGAAWLWPP